MEAPLRTDLPTVAYLCMEFGLARCLPFYAGGLGVLAGDYLKQASDAGYPLIGIGLLYRKGYFTQRLAEGEQIAESPALRFTDLPLEPVRQSEERWLRLRVPLGSQTLYLKVWRLQVGRVPLYLLDADLPENPEPLAALTHRLYPAQAEERLQQEIVLGFGAQALVEALGLAVDLFHYNEGHAAFHALAHWAHWRKAGLSVQAAWSECEPPPSSPRIPLCRPATTPSSRLAALLLGNLRHPRNRPFLGQLLGAGADAPRGRPVFPFSLLRAHSSVHQRRESASWAGFPPPICLPVPRLPPPRSAHSEHRQRGSPGHLASPSVDPKAFVACRPMGRPIRP